MAPHHWSEPCKTPDKSPHAVKLPHAQGCHASASAQRQRGGYCIQPNAHAMPLQAAGRGKGPGLTVCGITTHHELPVGELLALAAQRCRRLHRQLARVPHLRTRRAPSACCGGLGSDSFPKTLKLQLAAALGSAPPHLPAPWSAACRCRAPAECMPEQPTHVA